ncbi:hypothetical protein F5148DRAFT_1001730 [Russula earlei]|uniref:Uncharacterized protein n=1 Tax=Russula earlei TaxID=71964 RepID=A0ACC0U2L9_9AGAM|nr:hypothetical protein F5148DRAFT_1001730 [Russula earlei]
MSAKIYVGNLSWNTNDDTLRQAFAMYGNIVDSIVMRDRETQRSRGFGFVTYSNQAEAEYAIEKMNDTELDGRRIRVNIANARSSGGGSSSTGYGQSGYNTGGGYSNASYGNPGGYNQSSSSTGQGYGAQNPLGGGSFPAYPQQGIKQSHLAEQPANNPLQVTLKEAATNRATLKETSSKATKEAMAIDLPLIFCPGM